MNTALETLRHHVTGAIERGEAVAIEAIEQRRPSGNQYESRKRDILGALTSVHAMLIDVGYHRSAAQTARFLCDTQYARDCDRFANELARAQDTFRREVTIGRRHAARLGAIVREDSTIWAAGYMRHVFHCASGHRLTVQLRCVTLREQDARHIL